jgi:hypothetical protein
VEMVSRYASDGWAIAADPRTLLGRLAALTAETACVPFLALEKVTGMADSFAGSRLTTDLGPEVS